MKNELLKFREAIEEEENGKWKATKETENIKKKRIAQGPESIWQREDWSEGITDRNGALRQRKRQEKETKEMLKQRVNLVRKKLKGQGKDAGEQLEKNLNEL